MGGTQIQAHEAVSRCIAVLDVGTTAVKACLFSPSLELLACSVQEYALRTQGERVEADAAQYKAAARAGLADALSQAPGCIPAAVSITTQGETLTLADRSGEPLRPFLVWLDSRAENEAQALRSVLDNETFYKTTGLPEVTGALPLAKLLWLRKHEPDTFVRAHKLLLLEDYLLHFKGTVLAISHDRWFLDKVAQRIIEIVNGKAEFYNGNYTFYAEEKQRRYEELRRQYEKNQKEIAHLQKAADDLHLWAFMGADKLHKRAFSMEKRIARLQTAERPREDKKLSVRFRQKEFFGDEVLVLEDVAKSYGEKKLFSGIDELIEPGERIALIGDNGTGKSTLLRCITGEETPDRGWIHLGPAVKSAYLPQLVRFDDPSRNMVDTMLWEAKCDPQTARNRLAAFGFRGEDVFKTVSVLSGGEQSRLRLCILMRDDINFLMLDEPTNHLDLLSREWMEDALMDYSEALLFVSHDRWFIEKFATRIWCLHDGQIEDYRGGFAEWREYKARQEALQPPAKAAKSAAREEKPKKKTEPNRDRRRQKIERDIERAEASLRDIEAEMEKNASDYQKLLELGAQKDAAEESLETLYAEWETLAE